jgi:hypothetical protein
MKPKEIFNKFGALHIKDVVPKDICTFITQSMMRVPAYAGVHDDEQIPIINLCVENAKYSLTDFIVSDGNDNQDENGSSSKKSTKKNIVNEILRNAQD